MKTISATMDGYAFKKEPLEETYEVGEDIGSGHFAVVRRVTHKKTNHAYAAKFIRKRRGGGRKGARMEDIHKEVNILRQLSHNNVISLHDVYETSLEVILILELVTGGELFDYISEKDHLGEEEASAFIAQILHGLKHLHDKNIAHLDLKPENIMLLNRNSPRIKLIDFGLAQKLTEKEDIRALMGTAEFVAPEVVSYESLSLATDMWSIGVITYILLSGASPFLGDSQQETYHNITAINFQFDQEYFEHTSDLAKDFIKKLFVKNPRKRATVDDCLNHPWIRPKEQNEEIQRKSAVINIDNFKAFMARKRWKQSMRVVSLCNRLSKSMLLRKSTDTLGSRNTLDEEKTSKLSSVSETQVDSTQGVCNDQTGSTDTVQSQAVVTSDKTAAQGRKEGDSSQNSYDQQKSLNTEKHTGPNLDTASAGLAKGGNDTGVTSELTEDKQSQNTNSDQQKLVKSDSHSGLTSDLVNTSLGNKDQKAENNLRDSSADKVVLRNKNSLTAVRAGKVYETMVNEKHLRKDSTLPSHSEQDQLLHVEKTVQNDQRQQTGDGSQAVVAPGGRQTSLKEQYNEGILLTPSNEQGQSSHKETKTTVVLKSNESQSLSDEGSMRMNQQEQDSKITDASSKTEEAKPVMQNKRPEELSQNEDAASSSASNTCKYNQNTILDLVNSKCNEDIQKKKSVNKPAVPAKPRHLHVSPPSDNIECNHNTVLDQENSKCEVDKQKNKTVSKPAIPAKPLHLLAKGKTEKPESLDSKAAKFSKGQP